MINETSELRGDDIWPIVHRRDIKLGGHRKNCPHLCLKQSNECR